MANTQRRSTIEFALFLASFFAVWAVRATWLYAIDEAIASDTLRAVYSTLVKAVLWVAPAFGFAIWIRHASPFQYLALSVLPSRRQWAVCLETTGLFLLAVVGFAAGVEKKTFSTAGLSLTIASLLLFCVSPLIEEILFRGLVLKEFSRLLPAWGANVLTSLLFVGVHLPFWLSHGGLTAARSGQAIGVFVLSLVAGWLYLRGASIWPPTLAHIANNLLAAMLKL